MVLFVNKMLGVFALLFMIMLNSDITPKGGGRPEVTSSLQESKETHAFIAEYSRPILEYKDSLLDIRFVFKDAYIEYGRIKRTKLIEFGEPEYDLVPHEYFIAHFDCEAKLDDYVPTKEGYIHYPYYYKWVVPHQYYITHTDLNKGCGAIGCSATNGDRFSDTISFLVKHNYKYYDRSGKERPDIDFKNDTIAILKFVRVK